MNFAYEISNNASLKPEAKDALIFLGTLFEFDRNLISSGTDKRSKGKKLQTALKIHGFYFTKIDGVVGSGTRKSIVEYKTAKGLSLGSALDFEEEYQLISTAKQMNDKNIEDTIGSLKGLGAKQEAPAQVIKMQPVKSPYQ
jgi:peptidoglycan hydrolase-like protein with peptidoglycan-binding domain